MISFRPFRQWFFSTPGRKRMELIDDIGLHSSTATKVWNDGNVTLDTVNRICRHYKLNLHQVIEYIPDTSEKEGETEHEK